MERLTIDEIISHCKGIVRKKELLNSRDFFETESMGHYPMREYWEHRQVAEYLEELKEYRKAEEQGLLLRLPAYIGQTVYRINEGAENPIIPMAVTCIQHSGITKPFNKIFCVELGFGDLFEYRFTDIGITLFLTREEAESALAEKGGV